MFLVTLPPAAGFWAITVPISCSDSSSVTLPTRRPAPSIALRALSSDSPVTSGTATFSLPCETLSVTVLPRSTVVPPAGELSITWPLATVVGELLLDLRVQARGAQLVLRLLAAQPVDGRDRHLARARRHVDRDGRALLRRRAALRALRDHLVARRTSALSTRFCCTSKPLPCRVRDAVADVWPTTLGTPTSFGREHLVEAERDRRQRQQGEQPQPPAARLAVVLLEDVLDRRGRRRDQASGARARGQQRLDELVGVREPPRRVLLQRAQHDRVERRRDRRVELARRHRRLGDLLERDGDGRLGVERHAAGQHLVEDDPDRVQVRAGVDGLALRLLGRQVLRGAHHRARLGHVRRAGARDAEVGDLDAALLVDHHVVRLDVAVDDPALVGVAGGAQDLQHDVDRRLRRRRAALADDVLERAPADQLHRDVVGAVPLAAVEDADDAGVLQARRAGRLAPEALDERDVLGQVAVEQLERDAAPELLVLGLVDVGHPAGAELGDDLVAAVDHRVGLDGH